MTATPVGLLAPAVYWIAMLIGIVLAFIVWCFVWHERGWKRGYAAGLDKGLKDGYEAGKMHADNFWIHAEEAVKQERQKIWGKEGWP